VALGLGLYLVKVLHSPLTFTLYDELLHWRTANDIARTGHLFEWNHLLLISPLFPGLEIVTQALTSVGGLTIFAAGTLLLGVGRLVLVLALFLVYERISGSQRFAGIATLVYMANPSFVFFDAQFAYESLAIPLAVFVLLAIGRRARTYDGSQVALTIAILLALGAVVATHHLTTYALVAFLGIWTLLTFLRGQSTKHQPNPGGFALLAMVWSVTWLVYVASPTLTYLVTPLLNAAREFSLWTRGTILARYLFSDLTGQQAPLWQQVIGYGAVVLILTALPFGLLQIWRHHRTNPLALALATGALAYPASLMLRLVPAGLEASNRVSAFVFVAVAFVVAAAITRILASGRLGWGGPAGYAAWAAVVFAGGLIAGWPPWARLPGPYIVGADMRSVDDQSLAAVDWARIALGPGHRLVADRTNRTLMGSYGEQQGIIYGADGAPLWDLLFSPELGAPEQQLLRQGPVDYIVVDRRLSRGLPRVGVYVETGEPNTFRHTTPMNAAVLAKFDDAPGVSRVFDSGDLQIYDVAALAAAPIITDHAAEPPRGGFADELPPAPALQIAPEPALQIAPEEDEGGPADAQSDEGGPADAQP
jgi:hypothetical protein